MTTLSHAELVVLALLAEGPLHAYELVQRTRSMEVGRWARVPESTLYAVLGRMEEAGWVHGTVESGARRRTKTTYRRTEAGERRFETLVERALSEPAPVYSDLLVGAVLAGATGRSAGLAAAAREVGRARDAMAEALEDARLSPPGRVILEFYRGLADLHLAALRELGKVASTEESSAPGVVPEV